MKRILTLLLFAAGLLLPSLAHAQFITVTGILQDPNGAPYVNCTLVVTFNPAPGATQAPTINGQPFPTVIPLANCNAYGYFTVQNVADNLLVQDGHPAGQQTSTWSFRFCSGPGYVPQVCFIYTAVITHSPSTGNTIDISGQLSAIPPPILPTPGGGGGGGGGGTPLTLTTNGVNGAATLAGSTLNVPNYSLFVTTNNTSGPAGVTTGANGTTLNIPNYNVINSVTNTGQGGPPTLSGSILNIPQYQTPITVTTTGAGHASFAGNTLNIPANQVILTTNGTTGSSTFDPVTNILNIPSYSSGSGGGVPSGSIPGQLLIVGAGNTLAAANPGIAEAAGSPIAGAGNVTPNCASTTTIGDLSQTFVLQAGAIVNVPAAACANAVFYFFSQGASTFNAGTGQTLAIYNGATYTTGTTFAASAGQFVTLIRGKAANTWIMAVGNAGAGSTSQFITNLTTNGSGGPATVVSGTLNVPDYSTAPEPPPGIQIPSGALAGQVLAIDTTGANVIAGSPGLSDSSVSPATASYTPNCGGVVDTGDRSRITVVTTAITITIPPTTNVACKNAVLYFLFQAAATINRSGTDTFDIYNGSTALTAQTTYTAAVGAYVTVVNGSGANWHLLVESGAGTGGGGTPVQWQQQGTLLGTPTIINCTTNVTCSFAGSTVTMSAVGGTGPANGAIKPAATAGIIYLDNVNGNDSNDGLSWGSAKATLVNSYAALPANGGTIYMAKNWGACLNLPAAGVLLNVLHKTVVIQGAGAYSTCLQYNGTGNAITVDTGESSSMRDLYLESTVTTANGNGGLDVGPTNGCNKCSFIHTNVVGFTTAVYQDTNSYGTLWDHDQIGSCSAFPTATTTIAFYAAAGSDDTRISNSELLNCNTLFQMAGGVRGSIFITKTAFDTATQYWVNQLGGNFNCDQCHWYNPTGNVAVNWFRATGISMTITNSVFEDARTTGTVVQAGFVDAGCVLTFSNNFIYHYGGETVTQLIFINPGTPPTLPGGSLAPGGMNNTIYQTTPGQVSTLVPKLYNINPINQVIFPVNAGAITSSTIVSTGQGAAFTPQSSTVALISYQLSVTPTTATPAIYIYRTTGNIPAANAAPNAGDTIIVAGGMINAAIDTFRGAYYDAGITPGTLYRYYVAANTGGVATTFSATATYRVQITEKHE